MTSCEKCGAPTASDWAEGLCARCLLSAALQTTPVPPTMETAVPSSDSIGDSERPSQLGPIRLIRQLGKGGMGEVWLGRHELLGRNVAVKILTLAVADRDDPAFATFIEGARAAASVEHPSLNRVYHADVVHGVPHLVLELLDGPNVAELIDRSGALKLPIARAMLEAICEAVAELNQHDLLHRDVKPSNVVVTRDGRVVVTDFGLACTRPAGGTGAGVAGSPAYMAPEMFDGVVSVKTDVYALGMTAYHLLSGRTAFAGSLADQQRQHREAQLDAEPLRAVSVSQELIDVIVRATTRDPVYRSKSAWTVLQAFRSAFNAAGVRPASRDQLAGWAARCMQGPSAGRPGISSAPSPSSFMESLADLVTRKRESRVPTVAEVSKSATEPRAVWVWVRDFKDSRQGESIPREDQSQAVHPTNAQRLRAERRRVRVAGAIACLAGAGVGTAAAYCTGLFIAYVLSPTRSNLAWATCRVLVMVGSLSLVSVGASFILYWFLRGERGVKLAAHTACGWCTHELRGLFEPICPECGHRIGDRGPDEKGHRPLCLTWPWRLRALLLIAGFFPLWMLLAMLLVNFLTHWRELPIAFLPIALIPAIAMSLWFYEGCAALAVLQSGRSWCRVCANELKDLTEPVCPGCHTPI